ncbi:MAG TPA: hypothetical protein VK524_18555 [Polyangiaceae bacterium]|nr:hypothetical protein [Polyangiaceae bacterium]
MRTRSVYHDGCDIFQRGLGLDTTRIAQIVAALEGASGHTIPAENLARISPLLSARLLVSGRYNFDLASPPEDLEPA